VGSHAVFAQRITALKEMLHRYLSKNYLIKSLGEQKASELIEKAIETI
jgi:hypothetical protein